MSDIDDPTEPRIWPLARPADQPALIADPIVQSFALILLTSVFFLLFPDLDLWFSGLFYQRGYSFPFGRLPASSGLRTIASDVTILIVVGLLATLVVKLVLPLRPSLVAPRDVLFILGTLAIGPGIIVNLIFKDHWGRPRPVMLEVFSSAQPFVGAWHMSDACASNCSFVSGEASSAIWLLTTVVLLPPRWRVLAVKILVGVAIVLSLNRIAAGGHFLSDVLLAWWMTLAVIALVYRFLYLQPPPALTGTGLEAAMTRAGEAIHGVVRRLTSRPTV
jgi:membrane-associated phospholipid phosphatase